MKTLLHNAMLPKTKIRITRASMALLLAPLLALPLALGGITLAAQSAPPAFDATHLAVARDLNGTWLLKVGDDPAYANPGLDDSKWTAFDLNTPLSTVLHGSRPQIVWYRRRIQVDPTQTGIALREESLARAFEIYVNGERTITSGQFTPFRPYTYNSWMLAVLPERMVATGHLLIAVRVGITPQDWRNGFPGLSEGNLTLGPKDALADADWLNIIGQNSASLLDSFLDVSLGFVALALFASQRRHREYLWIFSLGMMHLAELPSRVFSLFINIPIEFRFLNAAFTMADPFLLAAMYFAFVGRRVHWRFGIFLALAGALNGYSILGNQGLVPVMTGGYGLLVNMPFVTLLAIVIPLVLAIDWRRGNGEAGILLIPAMFFSLFIYADYTFALLLQVPAWRVAAQRDLNLIQNLPAGPFVVSLNDVSGIVSTIALAIIMVLRASRTSRRQALLEGEMAAAAEVQQVILPEQLESIGGFAIESVYEPAQQVGGDFFQILPASDGGLLLILGDVAGKGLPAAMLVSMLVGAIRTIVDFTEAPYAILASLNERLVGRSGGAFSTALAAHFSHDGLVTIANAGQLSPYIDGRELELAGSLPLGILSGVEYPTLRFQLALGSRATFYSDGVVEAQDAQGELFGFERSQRISTEPATTIASTAKQFGQSDDITVVAITRSPRALSLPAA